MDSYHIQSKVLTHFLLLLFLLYSYSRELPSRFKKELLRAVQSPTSQSNDSIEVDSLNRILINIGKADQILSEDELTILLKDSGIKNTRSLTTNAILELV